MSQSHPRSQKYLPETELIYRLFSSEEIGEDEQVYPWNPAEPEAEEYYQAREAAFDMDSWSAAELEQSSNSFFAKLETCWPQQPQDLVAALCQKFASRIPQHWLERVAAEATTAASQKIAAANQLMACVRELIPALEEDVLFLVARPYANAMRCDPAAEDINNLARPIDWTELSQMEQAKLTMLVSKYALEQLNKD
jgi:hypothetical protein